MRRDRPAEHSSAWRDLTLVLRRRNPRPQALEAAADDRVEAERQRLGARLTAVEAEVGTCACSCKCALHRTLPRTELVPHTA